MLIAASISLVYLAFIKQQGYSGSLQIDSYQMRMFTEEYFSHSREAVPAEQDAIESDFLLYFENKTTCRQRFCSFRLADTFTVIQ